MMLPSDHRFQQLSVAVAPNIFDVLADSDQIATLCLANLLSPALWAFGEKVRDQVALTVPCDASEIPHSIRVIQKHINKGFTHLHPTEVAEIYGLADLRSERSRFDTLSFDRTVEALEYYFDGFRQKGGVFETVGAQVISWLKAGQFPGYFYVNYDLIRAQKNLTGRSTKSPHGLTSCLDEVALFIALAMVIPKIGDVRAIMVMSSVSHYGAFGYAEDGRSWWFNGKNQLFSKTDWEQMVAEQYGGNYQRCFDAFFSNFSRITTVSGTFDFESGETSIPEPYLEEYLHKLESFFRISLRQISEALKHQCAARPEAPHANFFRALLGVESRADVVNRVANTSEAWATKAFYNFRSLDVESHAPYLLNARRNPQVLAAALSAQSLDELVEIVRSLTGVRSIFNDRERIAMPDETLRLKTGTDRDKALLLHVLLEHYAKANHLELDVASVYAADESLVKVRGQWLDMSNFQIWNQPLPTSIKFRF